MIQVSEEQIKDFIKIYPELKNKCLVLNNFIDPDKILKLSTEKIIIIVLIVLIVISGVFLLIRKEEYNKTVIEVNDSKLSVGAVEKEISVKEEIDSLKKKYKNFL